MAKEKLLKNKKILVTGGPVWVPIDRVRVITNIFGGALGFLIAEKAAQMGAEVIFLLGPGKTEIPKNLPKNLEIKRFKYFEELLELMKKEIKVNKCDIVIHSAAVPDYVPKKIYNGKIKSGNKELTIKLKPTIKIVDLIKIWNPFVFLVKFKLEISLSEKQLINKAHKSMVFSKADLMVANNLDNVYKKHKAFILDNDKNIIDCNGKKIISQKLLYKISESL